MKTPSRQRHRGQTHRRGPPRRGLPGPAHLPRFPWFYVAGVASALVLPVLARSQGVPELFESRLRLLLELSVVIGVFLFVPLALGGEDLVPLLYGKAYVGCGAFMALMSAGVAFRLLGLSGILVAMARGDTRNELYANVWRCIVLPLSLLAVHNGGNPTTLAACALAGEIVGVGATLWRLRRVIKLSGRDVLPAVGYLAGFMILTVALLLARAQRMDLGVQLAITVATLLAAVLVAAKVFPGLWHFLLSSGSALRRRPDAAAQ